MFLIDDDGRPRERWGPLFDLDDVRASLDGLRPEDAGTTSSSSGGCLAWTAWNSSR